MTSCWFAFGTPVSGTPVSQKGGRLFQMALDDLHGSVQNFLPNIGGDFILVGFDKNRYRRPLGKFLCIGFLPEADPFSPKLEGLSV